MTSYVLAFHAGLPNFVRGSRSCVQASEVASTRTLPTYGRRFFCVINGNGIWLKVREIFKMRDKGHKTCGTAPLNLETSDRVWQQNERQVTFEDLPGERLLLESPIEQLLFVLRGRASAQPSGEVSGIERLTYPGDIEDEVAEGTEEDWSEIIDRLLRETRQNRPTLAPRRKWEG
jgi:hypothetical protein